MKHVKDARPWVAIVERWKPEVPPIHDGFNSREVGFHEGDAAGQSRYEMSRDKRVRVDEDGTGCRVDWQH